MGQIVRIWKSFFALPLWVILWISAFLIPANFAGFWYLDTTVGQWIAILGAGSILVNVVIMFINGGMSKVMALPHVACWIPLVFDVYDMQEWLGGNRSITGFEDETPRW